MTHPLRRARERAGLKLIEVAAASGITTQALRNLESGRSKPLVETAQRIAATLGVEVSDLWTPARPIMVKNEEE